MSYKKFSKEELQTEIDKIPDEIPHPFLGRLLIKVMNESVMDYKRKQYGMENSIIQLAVLEEDNLTVPIQKGLILRKSTDAFGEQFKRRYGSDCETADVGDVVYFIKNQSYKCHVENVYHMIGDQEVMGVIREKQTKVEV